MLNWRQTLPLWWTFCWRSMLYGLVLGALFGFLGGFFAAMANSPEKSVFYGTIGGWGAALFASLLALKQSVSRHLPALKAIG